MSDLPEDLIALVVALTLGAAVVILGVRRNLSEATQNGLPRFGGDRDGATAMVGLDEGEKRRRRPLSLRQRRWLVLVYTLLALIQGASAVLSSDQRLIHAAAAALIVLAAVVLLLRDPRGLVD